MTPTEEICRIKGEEIGVESPSGMEFSHVEVNCPGNADHVLENAREVLLSVLRAFERADPNRDQLVASVPGWFRGECAPKETSAQTRAKMEHRRSLPLTERIKEEDEEWWSLESWLHWFTDEERQWQ
ncbi:hypothetical protein [Saccharopolyspora gloriosae]|uniref:hypothetical protein n=1 Tax=Saccharopolyspora gloriosae TaxID=455344 RepID=UPI001FB58FF9|nr:hypothetical protein [Saccharopolyspora gloriosae]